MPFMSVAGTHAASHPAITLISGARAALNWTARVFTRALEARVGARSAIAIAPWVSPQVR